ncbi:unnamed protein product, partial [Tetraodon nigroviridis]
MPHRGPLTAVLTAVLGVTFGGVLVWRFYQTKRKRLPSFQKLADPVDAPCLGESAEPRPQPPPPPLEEAFKAAECRTQLPPAVQIPSCERLLAVRPLTVSSQDQWQQLWPRMQEELRLLPVLGLDCEWVSAKGKASSVSLLQMATYSGLCVLVRLQAFRSCQQPFPLSLAEVLRDPRVFKVGVGCYEDGRRLTRDYGLSLSCTVDLRYLALRQRDTKVNNGLSLKSLAADLLNVCLDKSLDVRCSDWEADQLSPEQVTYAARDAQVSVALFLSLLGILSEAGPASSSGSSYRELAARCQGLSPESGDQQVPDPRRNARRKALGVGYSARKSPLYDNCFLHAPDGQPLCTCDKKKAKWYLDKGIGGRRKFPAAGTASWCARRRLAPSRSLFFVSAPERRPLRGPAAVRAVGTPRLPAGLLPHRQGEPVRGLRQSRLLHQEEHRPSRVPPTLPHRDEGPQLARHPAALHQLPRHLQRVRRPVKQQLAEEFAAPQGCEEGVRLMENPERRRVRSAARALLTAGDGLPGQRREELQLLIRNFLNLEEQQECATRRCSRIFNEAYVPHGLKVVRAHAEQGLPGLMGLERRWREHFLVTMRPHHLPPFWAVDHNHSKFLRKYGADLPIKLN